jgi:hypothetical protein
MEPNNQQGISSKFEGAEFTERQTPTDFNSLLMYQLDRVNKAGCTLSTSTAEEYASTVEQLEILLTPYLDKKYEEYLEENKPRFESIRESMKKTSNDYHVSRTNYARGIIAIARIKLKGLMSLCARKNLFPGARVNLRA